MTDLADPVIEPVAITRNSTPFPLDTTVGFTTGFVFVDAVGMAAFWIGAKPRSAGTMTHGLRCLVNNSDGMLMKVHQKIVTSSGINQLTFWKGSRIVGNHSYTGNRPECCRFGWGERNGDIRCSRICGVFIPFLYLGLR